MYGWYAPDSRMRANIGIRRRLSTLLDGSRDEIGMGNNIWLPDRDSVRTPMQWTPDRNAGFSTADPGKLYLPAVQSLQYHYAAVNVESQMATSSSLLNWMRSMLQTRREHPAFGMGAYLPVEADNPAVLAFLRILESDPENGQPGETILCVNNLSRTAQGTHLRLPEWAGCEITDIFGGSGFDAVPADGQLALTMGSRDFYWLTVAGGPVS
jgi:maltose alpha-D-glucosyltransferase/alpha-amylase